MWVNTKIRHLKRCQLKFGMMIVVLRNEVGDDNDVLYDPHLKSTKAPFCLRPLLILQNDQLFRFWSRMEYDIFLPKNLLEFLLQCNLVLWKTRCPELVRMTEIFIGFFLYNTKALISDDNISILIFLIKFEKDSALDLMTKSWSFLIQLYFPQMW